MNYLFTPNPPTTLAIYQSVQTFPIRRVYCVGRNYADHAHEMGGDPKREPPFFFCKPADNKAIVPVGADGVASLPYPSATCDYHYEAELVVVLKQGGKNIAIADASQCIYGYAVGLDMTRRDLQAKLKQTGRPWEIAKAFDYSAVIGVIHTVAQVGMLDVGDIRLAVNGQIKQQGDIGAMIWRVPDIISQLSALFELCAGDVIFTGTPSGVGAVIQGDTIDVDIDKLGSISVEIV